MNSKFHPAFKLSSNFIFISVPSQPSNLRVLATSSTTVHVSWSKPSHPGEKVIGYELYWNDTFTQQQYHQSLPDTDSYTLTDLYPDTLYYVWVAARSRQGEGAATPPSQVRTDQYGKFLLEVK